MKKHPILAHLAIAILIWVILFVVITPFPYNMPHPEDFSPTAWLFAIGMTFYLLTQTGERRLFWRYLPIPLLAIFGFLEEISWGVEIHLFQPIYLQQFDLTVYDAHNFIPAITRIFLKNIGAEQWHSGLFAEFLNVDWLALIFVMAFLLAIRIGTKTMKGKKWRERILLAASFLSVIPSLIGLWQLLSLPVDPKHAALFGYSAERLLPIGVFIFLAVVGVIFSIRLLEPAYLSRLRGKIEIFSKEGVTGRKALGFVLTLFFVSAIVLQFIAPLNPPPDRIVQFERLIPLVGWLLAEASLLILALNAWDGSLRKPILEYFTPISRFFVNNPSYIYFLFAIGLIFFAQLIDKAYIPLNKYIITPNFWLPNWELWIEEISEMVAAVELVAAALFFPYKQK